MWILIVLISFSTIINARPDVSFLNTGNGYQTRTPIGQAFPLPMQQDLPTQERTMDFQTNYANPGTDMEPKLLLDPPAYMQDSYQQAYYHSGIPHESGYAAAMPQTQVHKHVYVHVPPQEFEDDAIQPNVYHQNVPKQKHYKIVFIKTPQPPAIRPAMAAPAPQSEEKTLIYVLHKKPEAQQDIIIPAAAPTTPSKPEVFFIKYKAKHEGAPVYGLPPAETEPRYSNAAAALEATTTIEPMSVENTTLPANMDSVTAPQSEVYLPPTMGSHEEANKEMMSNTAMPQARYGPPNHFFYKH